MPKSFKELFAGRPDAHGYYHRPQEQLGGVKREAKRGTLEEQVTDQHWDDHLNGEVGLGIVPVMIGDVVNWGCIDVDKYEGMGALAVKIEKRIQKLGLPLVVTRSKSGGAHCWVFFSKPAPAYQVIEKLKEWTELIGFKPGQKVDIFPAQESIANLDAGSWVNLPYFDANHDAQDRVGYGTQGQVLTLDEFLAHANNRMIHPADLDRVDEDIEKVEVAGEEVPRDHMQAPPCIQSMIVNGVTDSRNNALRQATVYLHRAFNDDWQDRSSEFNQTFMDPPLPYSEVGPLIRNIEAKGQSARYFCDRAPMVNACNKAECLKRDFGIGDKTVQNVEFEIQRIVKHNGDIPFYEVFIEGKAIRVAFEVLMSKRNFALAAGKVLDKMPRIPKKFDWDDYVNSIMVSNKFSVEESFEALTNGHQALAIFHEWAKNSVMKTEHIDRILEGVPVYHDNVLTFMPSELNRNLVKKGLMLKADELVPILRDVFKAVEVQKDLSGQKLRLFQITYKEEPWFVKESESEEVF